MSGFSVKLPLSYDPSDGFYTLNKTYEEVIKQNFKMLLLTNPGEKIMDSNYGIGLTNYLFQNSNNNTFSDIRSRIEQQVATYLPFIRINEILFADAENSIDLQQNEVSISISYEILPLKKNDVIQISL